MMIGDRPGKPPKPPFKASLGDKQLGRLAISLGERTPRGRASSIPSHAHARTRTHTHTRMHTRTCTHTYTHTYTHIRTSTQRTHKRTYTTEYTRMHVHNARTHVRARTRKHTHVGAAQRARRPSHRLALCSFMKCCPTRIGRMRVY